jgi:hypothetical protein
MEKLHLKKSGIDIYMTRSVNGRELSFMWHPAPTASRPYTNEEIAEIDECFLPWVRRIIPRNQS